MNIFERHTKEATKDLEDSVKEPLSNSESLKGIRATMMEKVKSIYRKMGIGKTW